VITYHTSFYAADICICSCIAYYILWQRLDRRQQRWREHRRLGRGRARRLGSHIIHCQVGRPKLVRIRKPVERYLDESRCRRADVLGGYARCAVDVVPESRLELVADIACPMLVEYALNRGEPVPDLPRPQPGRARRRTLSRSGSRHTRSRERSQAYSDAGC
jgi:hypothetical protein